MEEADYGFARVSQVKSRVDLISQGGSGHLDRLIFMRNVKDCIIRTPLLSAPSMQITGQASALSNADFMM